MCPELYYQRGSATCQDEVIIFPVPYLSNFIQRLGQFRSIEGETGKYSLCILCRAEYECLVGENIPYTTCGFNSLIDFLSSIKDVVIKNGILNVWDKKISHIADMVTKQKPSNKHSKNKRHVNNYTQDTDHQKPEYWQAYQSKNHISKDRHKPKRNNRKSKTPYIKAIPNGNSTTYQRKGAENREENLYNFRTKDEEKYAHKTRSWRIEMKTSHKNTYNDEQTTFDRTRSAFDNRTLNSEMPIQRGSDYSAEYAQDLTGNDYRPKYDQQSQKYHTNNNYQGDWKNSGYNMYNQRDIKNYNSWNNQCDWKNTAMNPTACPLCGRSGKWFWSTYNQSWNYGNVRY